jgi:predicted CxxxxCH...CXXCH cytochrome family protein
MMKSHKYSGVSGIIAAALLIILAGGCSELGDRVETYDWDNICTNCHGGLDNQTGAPPRDTRGNTGTSERGVGAHTAHAFESGLACDQCHKTIYHPESVFNDPDHMDTPPAEINFGPNSLAAHAGAEPSWDEATLTCRNTYCHGATLQGGTLKAPVWNRVGEGQTACGSCHEPGWSQPPPEDLSTDVAARRVHVLHTVDLRGPRLSCSACHPEPGGQNHINGEIELVDGTGSLEETGLCADCHGAVSSLAKQYWVSARGDWMEAGETAYCLNCHQAGQKPMGDHYATSGHGNDGAFPATLHGEDGPGYACSVCHDPDSPHLSGGSDPEHRLRIDNTGGALCLDCHGTEGDESLGSAHTKVTSHTSSITGRHGGVPQYNYGCAVCHNPHGTVNLAMIRETISGEFGIETAVEFTGDDLTGLDPTTDPDDGVCDACHALDNDAHAESNHPNNHNHGLSCMICHRHDRSFWF